MDLSSLNLDSLGDIMSSLTDEDISRLSSLAGEFFPSEKKENEKEKAKKESTPKSSTADLFSGLAPQMLEKIMSIMGKLNSSPKDPRCDFLSSLKPLLSKDKQQKADEAIKMLQLLSLIPILNELQ